jgi:hypothetical protein
MPAVADGVWLGVGCPDADAAAAGRRWMGPVAVGLAPLQAANAPKKRTTAAHLAALLRITPLLS